MMHRLHYERGDGTKMVAVVGESYRSGSRDLMPHPGTERLPATLMREPGNLADRNAVQVMMRGRLVGYFSRAVASEYRLALDRARELGVRVTVDGKLVKRRSKVGRDLTPQASVWLPTSKRLYADADA